jgi:glycosyltransferase involved in cell wall biosynthesis
MDHLILFMTERMSLRKWQDKGMLSREIALYRELARHIRVTIVSYGTQDEGHLLKDCPAKLDVVCNLDGLAAEDYVRSLQQRIQFAPGATAVKTNQLKGAQLAALFARSAGLPLIARAGYLPSDFARNKFSLNFIRKRLHLTETMRHERTIFAQAGLIVVSTELIKSQVIEQYGIDPQHIRVVPNYVDTGVFSVAEGTREKNRIIYIGRLEEQKNLAALIHACARLPGVELLLVGDGSLSPRLRKLAHKLTVNANFLGQRPNNELPSLLASATIFVLPSHYEGHPKTLIEAMATGIPVLGTDVPGIREIIVSGDNGLLCGTRPPEIAQGLALLLDAPESRQALGRSAASYANYHYSLSSIVELELENLAQVLRQPRLPLTSGKQR